jgi:Domain of unknown function (DUF4214)
MEGVMAVDTFQGGSGGAWQTAANWTGGVPTSTSDVVIPAGNLLVVSNDFASANTIMVGAGSELEVTFFSTFNDINASSPFGTFGFVDVVTADFVIGNGIYNNSGTFQLDSSNMFGVESRLLIGGNVTFEGAGQINLHISGTADAGSNQITSQSGIATLTDIDNLIFGSGSISGINFINKTTVETGVTGTLIIGGDAGGGSFNNQNLLQADEGGTLIFGNGADNAHIANTGTIELNESGTGLRTKMEIAGSVEIDGAGGGQIVFSGPSSANNTIVSNGTIATLTLNGGELTGVGSIGDANLTLNLKNFLVEETKVQLFVAAASTTIDADSKMEAANGGEIFIQGPVTNSGIINVLTGGEIFLSNTITNQGNGSIFIGPGGTLSLVGNGEINGIVQFTGAGATLAVSADHHISNSIQGTVSGDSFDLTYEPFQSGLQAVWQPAGIAGTLFLEKNGTILTTVSLLGQYTSSDFSVAQDANGNTLIKDIAAPSLSSLSSEDLVSEVYIGYYNRAPDQGGMSFWLNSMANGATLTQVANAFANSSESIAVYPFLSNPNLANASSFVTQVYSNLLNRAPDNPGLQFWSQELQSGAVTPGSFILAIEQSVNQQTGTADAMTLADKLTVAVDYVTRINAANVPFSETSAHGSLAPVTSDPSTIAIGEAVTTAYIGITQPVPPSVGLLH